MLLAYQLSLAQRTARLRNDNLNGQRSAGTASQCVVAPLRGAVANGQLEPEGPMKMEDRSGKIGGTDRRSAGRMTSLLYYIGWSAGLIFTRQLLVYERIQTYLLYFLTYSLSRQASFTQMMATDTGVSRYFLSR